MELQTISNAGFKGNEARLEHETLKKTFFWSLFQHKKNKNRKFCTEKSLKIEINFFLGEYNFVLIYLKLQY